MFFVPVLCFVFFSLGGQAWVFDFRNQCLAKLLSQNSHLTLKRTLLEDSRRTLASEGWFPSPSKAPLMPNMFLNGQCSARYPCFTHLHTRPPHTKRKKQTKKDKKKKNFEKSRGYLVSCTVAIFSSKIKLCTNSEPDS